MMKSRTIPKRVLTAAAAMPVADGRRVVALLAKQMQPQITGDPPQRIEELTGQISDAFELMMETAMLSVLAANEPGKKQP